MGHFQVVIMTTDDKMIKSPIVELNPGEEIFEVAQHIIQANEENETFIHIDGGDGFQLIVPMYNISTINVVPAKQASAVERIGASGTKLSLVPGAETAPG